jgi:hypothetical protein
VGVASSLLLLLFIKVSFSLGLDCPRAKFPQSAMARQRPSKTPWRAVLRRRPLPPRASAALSQCPKPGRHGGRPSNAPRQRRGSAPSKIQLEGGAPSPPTSSARQRSPITLPKNRTTRRSSLQRPAPSARQRPLEKPMEGGAPSPPIRTARQRGPIIAQKPDDTEVVPPTPRTIGAAAPLENPTGGRCSVAADSRGAAALASQRPVQKINLLPYTYR